MSSINHFVVGVSYLRDGRARLALENPQGETELFVVNAMHTGKLLPILLNRAIWNQGDELACGGVVFAGLREPGRCLADPRALERIALTGAGATQDFAAFYTNAQESPYKVIDES